MALHPVLHKHVSPSITAVCSRTNVLLWNYDSLVMTPTAPPPPYFQCWVLPSLVPAHAQCKIMIHPTRSRNCYSPFEAGLLPLPPPDSHNNFRWARCDVHVAQLVLRVFLLPLRLCFHVIRHCLSHLKTTNANLMLGKVQLYALFWSCWLHNKKKKT